MHLKFSYYSILNWIFYTIYIYAFYLIMAAFMVTIYSKKMISKNISLKLLKNKLGKYISMQPIYLQYNINIFLWLLLKLFPNPSCRSFISLHWMLAANIFFWHIFFWDAAKDAFLKKGVKKLIQKNWIRWSHRNLSCFLLPKPPLIYIFATFKSTFFFSAFLYFIFAAVAVLLDKRRLQKWVRFREKAQLHQLPPVFSNYNSAFPSLSYYLVVRFLALVTTMVWGNKM